MEEEKKLKKFKLWIVICMVVVVILLIVVGVLAIYIINSRALNKNNNQSAEMNNNTFQNNLGINTPINNQDNAVNGVQSDNNNSTNPNLNPELNDLMYFATKTDNNTDGTVKDMKLVAVTKSGQEITIYNYKYNNDGQDLSGWYDYFGNKIYLIIPSEDTYSKYDISYISLNDGNGNYKIHYITTYKITTNYHSIDGFTVTSDAIYFDADQSIKKYSLVTNSFENTILGSISVSNAVYLNSTKNGSDYVLYNKEGSDMYILNTSTNQSNLIASNAPQLMINPTNSLIYGNKIIDQTCNIINNTIFEYDATTNTKKEIYSREL